MMPDLVETLPKEKLAAPIEVLDLPIRPYNALKRAGIDYVWQILDIGPQGVLEVRNMGELSLEMVFTALSRHFDIPKEKLLLDLVSCGFEEETTPSQLSSMPLSSLRISSRTIKVLESEGIETVGEYIKAGTANILQNVGIGNSSLEEIENSLYHVNLGFSKSPSADLYSASAGIDNLQSMSSQLPSEKVLSVNSEIIQWQVDLIKTQMSARLLHKDAEISGKSIEYWLSLAGTTTTYELYHSFAIVLGSAVNISEEIADLFNAASSNYTSRNITAYYQRNGLGKTLAEIGNQLGITRERVRQICKKIEQELLRDIQASAQPLVRMQSALLFARDMGFDITYDTWLRNMNASGIVGYWPFSVDPQVDLLGVMLGICRAVGEAVPLLTIPENLEYAIELASSGTPNLPARIQQIRDKVSKPLRKLVRRHTQFTGCVNARWLSQESKTSLPKIIDILDAFGYQAATKVWFIPSVTDKSPEVNRNDVFHRTLRKMSCYCGPLSIDDICSGARHAVWRTNFPVPPPEVMVKMLRIYGYQLHDDQWFWEGETEETLSTGEVVILDCLENCGAVVHHAELAQAFIDSELSFPSLHSTLNRSPLFKRIDRGLYTLRGSHIATQDIERANFAGERVPLNLEVGYTKAGNIVISATLGILAVGTGVVFSEQLPNLSGKWKCYIDDRHFGQLEATENEFKHLRKPFEYLQCKTMDRVTFTFNAWERTVTIEKREKEDVER